MDFPVWQVCICVDRMCPHFALYVLGITKTATGGRQRVGALRRLGARVRRDIRDTWVWLPYPVKVNAVIFGAGVAFLVMINIELIWPLLVLPVIVGVFIVVRRKRHSGEADPP